MGAIQALTGYLEPSFAGGRYAVGNEQGCPAPLQNTIISSALMPPIPPVFVIESTRSLKKHAMWSRKLENMLYAPRRYVSL